MVSRKLVWDALDHILCPTDKVSAHSHLEAKCNSWEKHTWHRQMLGSSWATQSCWESVFPSFDIIWVPWPTSKPKKRSTPRSNDNQDPRCSKVLGKVCAWWMQIQKAQLAYTTSREHPHSQKQRILNIYFIRNITDMTNSLTVSYGVTKQNWHKVNCK